MNAEAVLNQVLSHVLTCVSAAVQILLEAKRAKVSFSLFALLKLTRNGAIRWKWEDTRENIVRR